MSNALTGSLTEQLDAFKTQSASAIPLRVQQALAAEADALIQSRLIDRSLKAGDRASLFSLPDALGKMVSLQTLLQSGPVVLTFYRGEWQSLLPSPPTSPGGSPAARDDRAATPPARASDHRSLPTPEASSSCHRSATAAHGATFCPNAVFALVVGANGSHPGGVSRYHESAGETLVAGVLDAEGT